MTASIGRFHLLRLQGTGAVRNSLQALLLSVGASLALMSTPTAQTTWHVAPNSGSGGGAAASDSSGSSSLAAGPGTSHAGNRAPRRPGFDSSNRSVLVLRLRMLFDRGVQARRGQNHGGQNHGGQNHAGCESVTNWS